MMITLKLATLNKRYLSFLSLFAGFIDEKTTCKKKVIITSKTGTIYFVPQDRTIIPPTFKQSLYKHMFKMYP